MNIKRFKKLLPIATLIFMLAAFALSSCQPQATATEQTEGEHAEEQENASEHEGGEHDEAASRIPNDGAVINIISPADGASFKAGEDIVVEVEVENFDLTAEGAHWHLYVDGSVYAQVLGGPTKEALHDLEPGEHEIEVYLGLPTHEELEDGGSITITVTE